MGARALTEAEFHERFWEKVRESEQHSYAGLPCWDWTAARCKQRGYGRVGTPGRKTRLSHRVAYEMLVAPIPEELTIDHLCKRVGCVNPWHMDPVPNSVNSQRAQAPRRERTHCINGHEYSASNDYRRSNGSRQCRACSAERMRRGRAAS